MLLNSLLMFGNLLLLRKSKRGPSSKKKAKNGNKGKAGKSGARNRNPASYHAGGSPETSDEEDNPYSGKNRSSANGMSHVKEPCKVRGDVMHRRHIAVYHIGTCEACRTFFRRTTQNSIRFTCPGNRDCVVERLGKAWRLRCDYCRFQRCVNVGLRVAGKFKFNSTVSFNRRDSSAQVAFHRAPAYRSNELQYFCASGIMCTAHAWNFLIEPKMLASVDMNVLIAMSFLQVSLIVLAVVLPLLTGLL